MLQRFREWLTVFLVAALPFHAFFVTIATKVIAGPGRAPLPWLAVWKEGLLGVILLLGIIGIIFRMPQLRRRVAEGTSILRRDVSATVIQTAPFDCIDVLIVGLFLLSIATSHQLPATSFLYGFKYDFLPLVALLILRRVPWSQWFKETVTKVLLCCGLIVALYGIVSFFLPLSFFTWVGYSPWHSLYSPSGPLAAFQQIGGSSVRRIQSTMSGPNQLGLWLLIPWSVGLVEIFRRKDVSGQWSVVSALLFVGSAILLTFSRSAWIAAVVIFAVASFQLLSRQTFKKVASAALAIVALVTILLLLIEPDFLLRAASTSDHFKRPIEAVKVMLAHPFGLGLGSAGPASNLTSDACVHLNTGEDAAWAKGRKDLCVFLGDRQVQPTDRACHCPLLPENWYLQIGVELGWLGFILYTALVLILLQKLQATSCPFDWLRAGELQADSPVAYRLPLTAFLVFLGLSIAALFLHAWEDSAVAYTVWIMLAVALSSSFARVSFSLPMQ